ncbi:long-chain-fatty-acid--CoA ligase [Ruegeria sp.]|uniref:long-chain-fatty-acid--CoA ligase n=1 Tax=Ruegeria sp. TaxID=1879320 RepID=UPI003B59CFAD
MSDPRPLPANFQPLPALEQPERTIDANLELSARLYGDRDAIIFNDAHIQYGQLWAMVEALTGYLQKKIGLKKGERALLYMQNSPQFLISFYAILRAGGVVIPANPMNKPEELKFLAEATGAKLVLSGAELIENLTPLQRGGEIRDIIAADYRDMADPNCPYPLPEPAQGDCPDVHEFQQALAAGLIPVPRETSPDDLAVIPFSSGTTGQPKGCMHTHRTTMATILSNGGWLELPEHCTHLATMPFFHVTGLQNSMNVPVFYGHTIVILSRWNAEIAADLIEHHKIGCWISISTMLIDLLNDERALNHDLSCLHTLSGGGAAMPKAVAQKLKQRIGRPYIEGYGLSETIAGTHVNPLDAPKEQCLGVPIHGVDARILAPESSEPVPIGEVGEIVVNAPQVFKGYWNDAEATQAAFLDLGGKPFFRTGDLAYRDAEGYFFIVDRLKRMINVSGFKVWPTEVESVLFGHPQIKEVCIIGVEDDRRGQHVKAHVVPVDGADLTAQGLIDWCHEKMSAYKCPKEVEFTTALPRSGTGKVLWRELS